MNVKKNEPAVFQRLGKYGRVCAILMLLNACTPNINGSFCDIYEPVYPDYERDTPETIRQIDRNNVVYERCGKE